MVLAQGPALVQADGLLLLVLGLSAPLDLSGRGFLYLFSILGFNWMTSRPQLLQILAEDGELVPEYAHLRIGLVEIQLKELVLALKF